MYVALRGRTNNLKRIKRVKLHVTSLKCTKRHLFFGAFFFTEPLREKTPSGATQRISNNFKIYNYGINVFHF